MAKRLAVVVVVAALVLLGLWIGGVVGPHAREGREAKPGGGAPLPEALAPRPDPAAAPGLAATPAGSKPDTSPKPAEVTGPRVTGRVVDRAGKGVAGATVVSIPDTCSKTLSAADAGTEGCPAFSATADADGRFVVAVATDAPLHILVASAPEYASVAKASVRPGEDVTIALPAAVALVGTVKDREGKPVANARVRALWLTDAVKSEKDARSGADGAYRISGLTPTPARGVWLAYFGRGWLEVTADGFAPLFLEDALPAGKGPEVRLDLTLSRGTVVTGKVLDAESGAGIPGARVALHSIEGMQGFARESGGSFQNPWAPRPLFETESKADGSYRFEHVPCEGPHPSASHNSSRSGGTALGGVSAWKPGFTSGGMNLELAKDGEVVETTVRLWPSATIVGRAVEADGTPIPDASVGAAAEGRTPEGWVPVFYEGVPRAWGKTGPDGRFRLDGVDAARSGPIEVTLTLRRPMTGRGSPYRPEGDGKATATVRAGETVDVGDVHLAKPEPTVYDTTTVVVNGPDGKAVWGAVVSRGLMGNAPRTDAEGRAFWAWGKPRAGTPLQPVTVSVRAKGFAPESATLYPPGSGRETVFVTLAAGRRIAGRVIQSDGTPASGATVSVGNGSLPATEVFPDDPRVYVVVDDGSDAGARRVFAAAACDEEGAFAAEDLPEGPYHVLATLRRRGGGMMAKPLRALVSGVAADRADVAVALPLDDSPPTGRVEGRLVDARTGQPVVASRLSLVQGHATVGSVMTLGRARPPGTEQAGIDSDGKFWFPDVPVGTVTLSVHATGYRDQEVGGIEVGVGATTTVPPVRLDPGITVTGQVRAPDGVSWKGRHLSFAPTERKDRQGWVDAVVSADGTFRATGFEPGTYRVTSPSQRPAEKDDPPLLPVEGGTVVVQEGETEVRCDASFAVAGTITLVPDDERLPPAAWNGKPTPEQKAFGDACRVRVTSAAGAVIFSAASAQRGGVGGDNSGWLTLLPGRYFARLEMPGGEAREETVDLSAGALVWVRFPKK